MYWKINQRLPVETPRDTSAFGRSPSSPSADTQFASVFAKRLNTGPVAATDMTGPLSTAFVQWLAQAAPPAADSAPTTTMDWMSGKASPAASPTPRPTSPAKPAAMAPAPISSLIQKAASRYQLDPALISSVIAQESSFDPQAVSPAGAQGLMQLMPDTARELHVADTFDPAQNIDGGSRYLAGLIKRYHGDVKLALAAYNWGMGNLERQPHKLPAETRHYVASIMHRWQAERGNRLA